jgi:molybdopterin/thiamine biosynthesis adenylyltransferase
MEERLVPGAADQDIFDRSRRVGWLDLEAVSRARVLVAGAGAIGNEVGKCLALSGFTRASVVDMDHVVGSNLNRCLFFTEADAAARRMKAEVVARGMERLSPIMRARAVVSRIEDLPADFYEGFDVVLGCLDNISARLHLNSHAFRAGKAYIDGGMDGFIGKVMVCIPPDGPCVQCGMNRTHSKVASLRFSCTGEGVVFHEPRLAAEITTTSLISAVMVRECLKVACGRTDSVLRNSFFYDGLRNVSDEIEISRDPRCPNHSQRPLHVSENHIMSGSVR